MDKYSLWAFEITGYKVTIHNPQEEKEVIWSAWTKFQSEKIGDLIIGKGHDSLHAVYYNYHNPKDLDKKGYDMLIGY